MADSRQMTTEEADALERGLDLAARLAGAPRPLSVWQVQALYNAFLEEELDDVESIIGLGLSFGFIFLGRGPIEWVRVVDEWGEENSLAIIGTKIFCHPISMIQKRIEKREKVDLQWLCDETLGRMMELRDKWHGGSD